MKLSIKSDNPNYLCKVVCLSGLRKHSNADKLQCCSIDGNNVITGLDAKDGDLYVYFPLECAVNSEYLSWSNSFSEPNLNKDVNKKGFFGKSCRVRAIKLRGEKSEGYIVPAFDIINWLNESGIKTSISDFQDGVEFDSINDIKFVEKYINKEALRKLLNEERHKNRKAGKVKRTSKLVDNQFRFHSDTEQLKRNISNLKPEDTITIGYKLHGANAVFSRVLVKKKLKWHERILTKIGVKIDDRIYDYLWSSRKVIKSNKYLE